jgi:hypothetical protein
MALSLYPIYPSDLTDAEWVQLAPLIPAVKPGGQLRSVNMRRIVNGLFYTEDYERLLRVVARRLSLLHDQGGVGLLGLLSVVLTRDGHGVGVVEGQWVHRRHRCVNGVLALPSRDSSGLPRRPP